MKLSKFYIVLFIVNILLGNSMKNYIDQKTVDLVIQKLLEKSDPRQKERIILGVTQIANLWNKEDGSKDDFINFAISHYISDEKLREIFFNRISDNFEQLYGNLNKIGLCFRKQTELDLGEIYPFDEIFAAYDPFAHLGEDFFKNKLAFYIILNFPNYTLEQKNTLSKNWSRKEWAYARVGDMFISRVPADVNIKITETLSKADNYISNYNIYTNTLVDDKLNNIFNNNLKLISHWGLRDEIKAQYANPDGLQKQDYIYAVMKRIISQEIPENVINNSSFKWDPINNKLYKDNKEIKFNPEPNKRYKTLLNNFHAVKLADEHYPNYPTYIDRKFNLELEITKDEIKKIFDELCSSDVLVDIGKLIEKRLNRKLKPFDIWYDGFKSRSSITQEELDNIVKSKYPNIQSFQADLKNILTKLGYTEQKAKYIADKIVVDPARGAGHAAGAMMKGDVAHLRTRVPANGMDYKGFNIACHEFGHNVEQTITLYDVDYYMLQGVLNTAFTEALAFTFQKRDLYLLDIKDENHLKEHLQTLDIIWGTFEIMGVSLVDIEVWEWLYQHPNATDQELKEQTIKTAKNIWNKYFARIFNTKDEPILAIYSHMIDYPLYLPAYPLGHLIEFAIEEKLKSGNFADNIQEIFTTGKITPYFWMLKNFNYNISAKPMINKAKEALNYVK